MHEATDSYARYPAQSGSLRRKPLSPRRPKSERVCTVEQSSSFTERKPFLAFGVRALLVTKAAARTTGMPKGETGSRAMRAVTADPLCVSAAKCGPLTPPQWPLAVLAASRVSKLASRLLPTIPIMVHERETQPQRGNVNQE